MSGPEWTRQKKNKLIDLYRLAPILWARKGQKVHPRQRSNALQQIADEIGVNVLEVEKKLHVLRSQFMRERKRILNSQLNGDEEIYQSHWQYYKKLEFLSCLLEPYASHIILNMGLKANATGEGESSNQSASKGETGDGTEDVNSEDIPTQLNVHVHNKQVCMSEATTVLPVHVYGTEDVNSEDIPTQLNVHVHNKQACMSEATTVLPVHVYGTEDVNSEDIPTQLNVHLHNKQEATTVLPVHVSSNPFPRKEQSFQNPDDSSFAIRHDETDIVQDETPNRVDFPTGGIDDTLVSFGNYLVSLLRRLPLDKSYQLQQKFISETMNTTVQFEKERALLLQKKRKNEVNQTHDRFYTPTPLGPRLEHSRVDGPSKKGILSRNNSFDLFSSSQKTGQALQPNKMYSSGGGHNLYGGNRDTNEISIEEGPHFSHIKKELETSFEAVYCNGLPSFHSTVAEGVSGGLEVHSEDSKVMCVQCDVCKELFRTSAELKRHQAAKHREEKNESLNRGEVASKRLRLEDRSLTSPMSSTFIIPGRPHSAASDRSH